MYWITSSIVQSAGAPLGSCWLANAVVGVVGAVGVEDSEGGEGGKPVAVIAVVGRVADGDPVW